MSIKNTSLLLLLLLQDRVTYNQVQTPTLQPTHWASINSAIGSTQSSVRVLVEMIHMHTYIGKGV